MFFPPASWLCWCWCHVILPDCTGLWCVTMWRGEIVRVKFACASAGLRHIAFSQHSGVSSRTFLCQPRRNCRRMEQAKKTGTWPVFLGRVRPDYFDTARRRAKPIPNNAIPSNSVVPGSGTFAMLSASCENGANCVMSMSCVPSHFLPPQSAVLYKSK